MIYDFHRLQFRKRGNHGGKYFFIIYRNIKKKIYDRN